MAKCIVCGLNDAPDDVACVFCYFSGRYFEMVLTSDERSNVLSRIRQLEEVEQAEVWHHSEGAFILTVKLRDGRYIIPGIRVPSELLEEGQQAVMPAIPPVGMPWGVAVSSDPMENPIKTTVMSDEVDDDGLVKTIEEISTLETLVN